MLSWALGWALCPACSLCRSKSEPINHTPAFHTMRPICIQIAHNNKVLLFWITALGIFNYHIKPVNFLCSFIGVGVDNNKGSIEVTAQCPERCDIRLSVKRVTRWLWVCLGRRSDFYGEIIKMKLDK